MSDTKPDIPQEMTRRLADELVCSLAAAEQLLIDAGVGELIAEKAFDELALARYRNEFASRPSRETVDKLVEALGRLLWVVDESPGALATVNAVGKAREALSAYESETKR